MGTLPLLAQRERDALRNLGSADVRLPLEQWLKPSATPLIQARRPVFFLHNKPYEKIEAPDNYQKNASAFLQNMVENKPVLLWQYGGIDVTEIGLGSNISQVLQEAGFKTISRLMTISLGNLREIVRDYDAAQEIKAAIINAIHL